jgi:hypothetical protein
MTLNDKLNELAKLAEQRITADKTGNPTELFDAEIKDKFASALNHNASMFDQIRQALATKLQDDEK